jgi:hypothetical protein
VRTLEEVQAALLAYLKAQPTLVAMLGVNERIKETQWQGEDFTYPAVRLGNDIIPDIAGCPPDKVEGVVWVFSENKTSKQCSQIASEVARLLHRIQFDGVQYVGGSTVKFSKLWVTRVTYPTQMEGMSIWQSQVQIQGMVN